MHNVDYVFHAAALKQYPHVSSSDRSSRTNVLVAKKCWSQRSAQVKKAIVLSTDKAVYPIMQWEMSKALSEKVMVAKSRSLNGTGIVFLWNRYGNVMASRGSVIPLFVNQNKK